MQISPSSAEPRKGSRGPFSYQRKNTGSRSFPPRLSGKNTRSPANMATSVPMCPQALGRGCHALYPAGELCHRRLDMLTRSLLSAVFCLLPIILQPLPVAAESILLDGRMTTTTRPWLDKRARQWLDAREPLTIGVVSPDYPPLSIFYAGSYKGFTADYLALVFERPLRVRDFPSRQAAIAALSRERSICSVSVARSRPGNTDCWHPLRIFPTGRYWCLPAAPRSIRRRSPGWPRSRVIFPPNVSRPPIRTARSSGSTRRSLPWKR